MTKEQFESLNIGDMVLGTQGGKELRVTDICRTRGLICTGGTWRKRSAVAVPDNWDDKFRTRLEPVYRYSFSVKMLRRFGLVISATILTLKRAGKDGFVGSNENLCDALQIGVPRSTFYAFYKRMCAENIITVEKTSTSLKRYRLNEDAVKDYL